MEIYPVLDKKVDAILQNKKQASVDYIGINIDSLGRTKYKIYYYDNDLARVPEEGILSPLINKLTEQQLVRSDIFVDDDNSHLVRHELRIKAIEDEEILSLLQQLGSGTALIPENIDEILYFSRMPVFDGGSRTLAALYYLGLIEQGGRICAVKCHFMTRKEIHYRNHYDDRYYLACMREAGIPELNELTTLSAMLAGRLGHVHLMGADYFYNSSNKYKIYFCLQDKNVADIIQCLEEIIPDYSFGSIRQQLEKAAIFISGRNCLFPKLVALCMDKEGRFSINVYFHFKEQQNVSDQGGNCFA